MASVISPAFESGDKLVGGDLRLRGKEVIRLKKTEGSSRFGLCRCRRKPSFTENLLVVRQGMLAAAEVDIDLVDPGMI